MSSSKRSKPRGRPPKYVRDCRGREIVGLSYHKGVGQYYLTFSDPRVYIGNDKDKAVETFHRKKEYEKLPPEAQEEAKRKNEIYQEALELLNYDECIQEQLCDKARAELDKIFSQEDQYIASPYDALRRVSKERMSKPVIEYTKKALSTYLYKYFVTEEVKKVLHFSDISHEKAMDFIGELVLKDFLQYLNRLSKNNSDCSKFINAAVNEEVQEKIRKEAMALVADDIDSLALDRAYDLIVENPVYAAIKTGIQELAYLAMCPVTDEWNYYFHWSRDYSMPLPWWLVWEIYGYSGTNNLTKEGYETQRNAWKTSGIVIGMTKNVKSITESDIRVALNFDYSSLNTLEIEYDRIEWQHIQCYLGEIYYKGILPAHKRIDALKTVSSRVLGLGYHQCSTLCDILKDMH